MALTHKSQWLPLICMLLVTCMLAISMQPKRLPAAPQAAASVVTVKSSCAQTRSAASLTRNFCSSQLEFKSILSSFVFFFATITGKLFFAFIISLFAASYQRRIDRPPKCVAV